MKKFVVLFLSLGLLFGCSNGESVKDASEKVVDNEKAQVVTVVVSKNNGDEIIEQKAIKIEEGQKITVMDVMEANFEVETQFDGAFISSINGIAGNESEKTSWFYSVNGEEAMVGANEFELKPEDKVEFDLHKWE